MTDAPLTWYPPSSDALCIDGVCVMPPSTPPEKREVTVHTESLTIDATVRFEIIDVVTRYATAIDTREWDLFRSTFTDDAVVDYGAGVGTWTGVDAFTAFMRETHDPAGRTLHRMSNTVVTGVDPLSARTYGDAIVLEADNTKGTMATGWYDDEFVRTEQGLRIRRRVLKMVVFTPVGPNLAAAM